MDFLIHLLLTGIVVGGIYALIAVGFIVIYKSTKIFNLAQGAILVLGAYMTWTFLTEMGLPIWLGLLLGLVFAVILGLLLERLAFRPLIGQPIFALVMVTLFLSVLLEGIAKAKWSGPSINFYPSFLPTQPIYVGKVPLSSPHLCCFGIAILAIILLNLYFNKTRSGLGLRGVAEDQQLAQSTGIDVKRAFSLSWVIGCVITIIGGILLGALNGISFELSPLALKVLPVVFLGGLESIYGALIAGLIVGVLESLAIGYIGEGIEEVFAFVILLIVLLVKPYGLFGLARIERV